LKGYDVIIIGAGISGLSLAHYCAGAGLSTLVLEKSDRPGGSFHSHGFGGEADGFWLELGAHTCYNSYGSFIDIMRDCGITDRIKARRKVPFKLLVDSQLKSIPSRLDFMELLFSVPRMFRVKKQGETMESYYSKIMGRTNYLRVFGPVFNAIISQRANDFPADALFKKRPHRKDVLKSFTFKEGLSTLTDAIAAQPDITLVTGHDVRSVNFSGGHYFIGTENGGFQSKYLAVATPPPPAAALLKDAFPELSARLSLIKVGNVETVGAVLKKDAVQLPQMAGIIAVDDFFFSSVTRDTVSDERYRGFAFHFKPGMYSLDKKLERMGQVLRVDPAMFLQTVEKNDNFVPSLTLGHDSWVKETDKFLSGKTLYLTGNYFSGVAIEDCVSRSKAEFERMQGPGSSQG